MSREFIQIGDRFGSVDIPADIKPASSTDIIDRAATARQWNTRENMEAFLGRASVGVVDLGEDRLHFAVSDNPYSPDHIMFVVENEQMLDRPDWREGLVIHDQSENLRIAYALSAMVTSDYYREHVSDDGDMVVFSENTCCRVTNEAEHLPRTVGLIHAHAVRFPGAQIRETGFQPEKQIDTFAREVELWQEKGDSFLQDINDRLGENNSGVVFNRRETKLPPGYYTELPRQDGDIQVARSISETMHAHHLAYQGAVRNFVVAPDLQPQPSYRTYLEVQKDCLRLSYAPVLYATNGGISAAGLDLKRTIVPGSVDEKRVVVSRMFEPVGRKISQSLNEGGVPNLYRKMK